MKKRDQKPTILIVYQYFGTPKGGWSTRFYEFTRRWVSAGYEIKVITAPYYKSDIIADGFIARQVIEGVSLIVINTPDSNKQGVLRRAFNALAFAFVSTYYSLTLSYDLVLASSGPITVGIPALAAKWIRGKKMVFEVRDLWPRGGIELGKIKNKWLIRSALWFERICYQNSSLVVACSEGMRDGVNEVYSHVRTKVIPNSSDPALFSQETSIPQGFELDQREIPLFVYIGSLGLMDDCSQILTGLALVRSEKFKMVFLGDGEERGKLEILAKEFGLEQRVDFLGLVPKLEVAKWLRLARASFVTFKDVPVLHTNSPNKMFDSFAAGIPIIQSTKGWIKKLVETNDVGWNVDPGEPATFAQAIEEAMANPDLSKQKGRNALVLANGEFGRDHQSEAYLAEIKSILQ